MSVTLQLLKNNSINWLRHKTCASELSEFESLTTSLSLELNSSVFLFGSSFVPYVGDNLLILHYSSKFKTYCE